jgi:hypothetical protein
LYARQYSVVKDLDCVSNQLNGQAQQTTDWPGMTAFLFLPFALCLLIPRTAKRCVVGLGGLEPPTSSLSGMRSSHLSYRPGPRLKSASLTGGAGRDRTGDLLNANQALSQLSYSPKRK